MSSPTSFHDIALVPLLSGLKNAHATLTKAAAHVESIGHNPAEYTNARLFPDMFNLAQQVYRFTDAAKFIPPRVNPAVTAITLPDVEQTFPELLERISKTIVYLESVDAKSFEDREEEIVTILLAKGTIKLELGALRYVQVYAQPNFWFHYTTMYDILRSKGVPLGKTDFLNGSGDVKVEVLSKPE